MRFIFIYKIIYKCKPYVVENVVVNDWLTTVFVTQLIVFKEFVPKLLHAKIQSVEILSSIGLGY